MNTLIVDDEQDGRESLHRFLLKYCPEVSSIREAASVAAAVEAVREYPPDLVFLDINMPEENGFALFAALPTPSFRVIFVTAYDQYALQAIRHEALDYLLKPVNIDELIRAVSKASSGLQHHNIQRSVERLAALLNGAEPRISLPVTEGFLYVPVQDIIRCEAEGNYTLFYCRNRPKVVVSRTLGSYQEQLEALGFVRIHHQHLVNVQHVEKYHRGRGGMVQMSDGKMIDVSQRKKEEFLRRIEGRMV